MNPIPLCALLLALCLGSIGHAAERPLTLSTGGATGVYQVAGAAICRLALRHAANVACQAQLSDGGRANLAGLRRGQFPLAIIQASQLAAPDAEPGPPLYTLFALHTEVFTLLAREAAQIRALDDLPGKRLSLGKPGSGQHQSLGQIMQLKQWTPATFAASPELAAAEQASALAADRIDAMSYFVGHPNGAIQQASHHTAAHLVPLTEEEIEGLTRLNPGYVAAQIPGGIYPGNPQPTPSIGSRALLVSTAELDDEQAYALVKVVFDHHPRFVRLHPALRPLQPAQMIQPSPGAPLHPGAARYYRERGWL
jgi:TRAP transporter TAXI family solute receptor